MTDSDVSPKDRRVVYKVVLTGGPCAGKTTTVARLRTYFEGLGWKVYAIPEAATILLGGGDKWADITAAQNMKFIENILATILQLEKTFFDLAKGDSCNVIVVCDRGAMDPSAFCSDECWKEALTSLGLDPVQLRDTRYDQIIHMVTAADGAYSFYQKTNNPTRTETSEQAKKIDANAVQAWVGHPYVDIVDNSTDFEKKIHRVIETVCMRLGNRLGVDRDDRLQAQSRKRLFLVKCVPDIKVFPTPVCDVEVQYDYLLGTTSQSQTKIRKRGQHGQYMYTLTEKEIVNGEMVEQKRQLTSREYQTLYKQRDPNHHAIMKTRYSFLWKRHYFQLDDFREPERCRKLVFLETFTTKRGSDLELPDFLEIDGDVTNNPDYSMYMLSAKKPTANHN